MCIRDRVSIDLRRNVEPETIKRQLYKFTPLESSFGFNTLAIVDGKPQTCNLKEFLSSNDLKFPQLGKPLRLILAGRENAPSISQLLFFLGYEESLKRINLFFN